MRKISLQSVDTTARTENLGAIHEQLIELVGPEKAIALVANTIWPSADPKSNSQADA